MSYLKKILAKFRSNGSDASFPVSKSIIIPSNLIIGKYVNINIQNNSSLSIGNNVCFREFCNILIFEKGELNIGNNAFFNNYCSINCLGKISIGDDTILGEGVKLYDHNHKYSYEQANLKVGKNDFKIGEISIGKNCWLGSNVTILNNVEIGDNVIIGANCLIYKSIPSNSIVKHVENLIIETH